MGLVLLLSARHTIIHYNTAHILSNLSSQILFGSSKRMNIQRFNWEKLPPEKPFSPVIQKLLYSQTFICLFTSEKWISTYRNDLLLARVDDTDFLVLAGSADETAIAVPAGAEDDVRVHILQGDHGLSRAHIPDENHIITACRQTREKNHAMWEITMFECWRIYSLESSWIVFSHLKAG